MTSINSKKFGIQIQKKVNKRIDKVIYRGFLKFSRWKKNIEVVFLQANFYTFIVKLCKVTSVVKPLLYMYTCVGVNVFQVKPIIPNLTQFNLLW